MMGDLDVNDEIELEDASNDECIELEDGDISELILPNDVGFNDVGNPVYNSTRVDLTPTRNSLINQLDSSPSPIRNASKTNRIESSPSPPSPPRRMENRTSVESSPVQHQSVATSTSFVDPPPIEEDNSKDLKPERLALIDGELEKVKNGTVEIFKFHGKFYNDAYRAYIHNKAEEMGLYHKSTGTINRVLHISKKEITFETGSKFGNMMARYSQAQIPDDPRVAEVINQNENNIEKKGKMICPHDGCTSTLASYRYLKSHYTRMHKGVPCPAENTIKFVE
jgi:hypothetical protein